MIIKIIQRYNHILVLAFSGIIYLISYIQRIKHVIDLGDNMALVIFVNAIVLVGTSQLPLIIGIIFAKEKVYSKVYNKFHNNKFKNAICIMGIFILFFLHALYESMIIAPFTAISFICLFTLMNKSAWIQSTLPFFWKTLNKYLVNTHVFLYVFISRTSICT